MHTMSAADLRFQEVSQVMCSPLASMDQKVNVCVLTRMITPRLLRRHEE